MLRSLLFGTVLAPVALAAQQLPIPLRNSSIAPSAQAPAPEPTPTPAQTPGPSAAATPAPEPTAPRAIATPRAEPTPRPAPTSAATPEPTASATSSADPSPPTPPTAAPTGPIETVVLPPPREGTPLWPWFAGGAALLLVLALLLLRCRRPAAEEWHEPPEPAEADLPPPPPAAARLAIDLRPVRAGVNLLTATVDAEVIVTNIGDMPASDIRAVVALNGARGDEAGVIEQLAAQPIAKPDTPPFALAPGEARRFRTVAAVSLDAIEPLHAGGRPLLVPLAVATLAWRDDGGMRRTTHGFAVGVHRDDSPKLQPLWLDAAPRSYDDVAARAHGEPLEG